MALHALRLAGSLVGAKVLLVEGVQGVFPRFVSDCTQQGYTPYYLSSGFSTTPDLPTIPGLNNRLIGIMLCHSYFPSFFSTCPPKPRRMAESNLF